MPRNLDMTALRAFLAVCEAGGVTRAALQLHLTQSTVSMQLKRLELALGMPLLDRSRRGVRPTAAGEQLLGYARKILALNDEAWQRLDPDEQAGELRLGVPHDVVYPHVPQVLKRFAEVHSTVKVTVRVGCTRPLRALLERGELDLTMATELQRGPGGRVLGHEPLHWMGSPGGQAWRRRPLRLAFEHECMFRDGALAALTQEEIPWEVVVEADSIRAVESCVSADLAVSVFLDAGAPPQLAVIDGLPALPECQVNVYLAPGAHQPLAEELAQHLVDVYAGAGGDQRPGLTVVSTAGSGPTS